MSLNLQEKHKTCAYCEKVLHGRSDQVYCNDSCRNTFNRQKRAAEKISEHENMPEILRVIKKNYELLKQRPNRAIEENEWISRKTSDFIASGINPKFYTSSFADENGTIWYCIFERCFKIDGEDTYVKDFPRQALI